MSSWQHDAMAILTASVILIICAYMPIKQLDAKVDPIAYNNVSLAELCDRLYRDYGIVCCISDRSAQTYRLSFSTDRPLSQRAILEKLSCDTNRPLHIGYCGFGATILFGANPSFTYLGERKGVDNDRSQNIVQPNQ